MATKDAVPRTSQLLASFLVPSDKKGKRKRDEAFGTTTGDFDSCTNSQDKNGDENSSDRCALPGKKRHISSLVEESRDRDKYFDRVETYKILTWFGKPNELSPLVCARYGWKNTDFDILECVLCKAVFCGQLPKTSDKNIYTEYVNKIHEKLTSAHEKACKWASNPTPESFNYVPSLDKSESISDFNQRLTSLLHLRRQLPIVSLTSLQDEGLEEEMVVRFTDKIRTQFSEYTQDTEVIQQAALLTVCGWERKNNVDKENVITCYCCHRNVKLSSYVTLHNDSNDQTDFDSTENIACRTDQSDLSHSNVHSDTENNEKDSENGIVNGVAERESDILNKSSTSSNGGSTEIQNSKSDLDSVSRADLNGQEKCSDLDQESENNQQQHYNGDLLENIESHNDQCNIDQSVSDRIGEEESSKSHNDQCDIDQSVSDRIGEEESSKSHNDQCDIDQSVSDRIGEQESSKSHNDQCDIDQSVSDRIGEEESSKCHNDQCDIDQSVSDRIGKEESSKNHNDQCDIDQSVSDRIGEEENSKSHNDQCHIDQSVSDRIGEQENSKSHNDKCHIDQSVSDRIGEQENSKSHNDQCHIDQSVSDRIGEQENSKSHNDQCDIDKSMSNKTCEQENSESHYDQCDIDKCVSNRIGEQENSESHNDQCNIDQSVPDKTGKQENSESHDNECDANQLECNIQDKNATDVQRDENKKEIDDETTCDNGVPDAGDKKGNQVYEKGNSEKHEDRITQLKHLDPLREHRNWCPWVNNSQSCSSCRYSLASSAESHRSLSTTLRSPTINDSSKNRTISKFVSNQRSPSTATESSISDSLLDRSVSYDTVMFPWKRLMLLLYPSLLEPNVLNVSFTEQSKNVSPRDKMKRLHMMMQELQD